MPRPVDGFHYCPMLTAHCLSPLSAPAVCRYCYPMTLTTWPKLPPIRGYQPWRVCTGWTPVPASLTESAPMTMPTNRARPIRCPRCASWGATVYSPMLLIRGHAKNPTTAYRLRRVHRARSQRRLVISPTSTTARCISSWASRSSVPIRW